MCIAFFYMASPATQLSLLSLHWHTRNVVVTSYSRSAPTGLSRGNDSEAPATLPTTAGLPPPTAPRATPPSPPPPTGTARAPSPPALPPPEKPAPLPERAAAIKAGMGHPDSPPQARRRKKRRGPLSSVVDPTQILAIRRKRK